MSGAAMCRWPTCLPVGRWTRRCAAAGRRAAPVRLAGLVAAGAGRRALADRPLLAATSIAVTGLLRQPGAARTVVAAAAGAR